MNHRLLLAMAGLFACDHKIIIEQVPADADVATPAATTPAAEAAPPGRLVLQAAEPANPGNAGFVSEVAQSQSLAGAVALFNRKFTFPHDIPVVSQECGGVVNAFYAPERHTIIICYELMAALGSVYPVAQDGFTVGQQWSVLAQEVAFVALHEAGHAFIAENQIPILGREEDVVDEISGVTFVAGKQPGIPLVGTEGLLNVFTGASFADTHSLSQQRYFDMLCLIYGSDPEMYPAYIGDEARWLLPPERAANCPREWSQKSGALEALAGRFLRK